MCPVALLSNLWIILLPDDSEQRRLILQFAVWSLCCAVSMCSVQYIILRVSYWKSTYSKLPPEPSIFPSTQTSSIHPREYTLSVLRQDLVYGDFHQGRELTAIEMENFWFAVKPISVWIYFKDLCAFVYVSIFLGKRSSSNLFTSFTCWTCLKWPPNLAINENIYFEVHLSIVCSNFQIICPIFRTRFKKPLKFAFQDSLWNHQFLNKIQS